MVEMTKKEMETSHWWWFDSHHSSLRSPWLQSTLAELDNKTKAMLKVIEEDADSFAQRAEMYYKKRPELISMVEDFYRTHRSLAERYDQLKSDSGNRLLTTLGSPFSAKYQSQKFMGGMDRADDSHSETYELQKSVGGMNRAYDSHSETYEHQKFVCGMNQTYDSHSDIYDLEDSAESEVDDPEQADETQSEIEMGEVEEPEQRLETREVQAEDLGTVCNDEVAKLHEEIERLKEENRIQKDQLLQKDEEKREVIRQLSLAVEVIKLENLKLRKCVARDSPKKGSFFEFNKLKEVFSGKLFNGSANSRLSVVAL
ncbi:conserved hypothetical protein [Ricinus communis]|uniref:NAB domain-containing protein n=1 Tax=Ricinus communis TaxID=3988 RepID=B9S3W8_RICCO|nr:conserved hypothetical protein [Ricinus communis]|eukprot:XP_002520687.1 protein NETWORKED 3C [Ricinus communis]